MTVFVATSKRYYDEAKTLVYRLKEAVVRVYYPYFHRRSKKNRCGSQAKIKSDGTAFS